jgi:hypothetical protein
VLIIPCAWGSQLPGHNHHHKLHASHQGPIYGGIIVAALGLSIADHDILLAPQRLDLAAMKLHHFVTANSCAGKLVYRMLFTDGEEREVPLP